MFEYEPARAAQSFAYKLKGDSAVILRCFSHDTRAEIPEQLEGHPVTEVGAYAFSAHFEERKLSEELHADYAMLYVPELLKFGMGGAGWADESGAETTPRQEGNVMAPVPREDSRAGIGMASAPREDSRAGIGMALAPREDSRAGIGMASAPREDSRTGIALPPALCGERLEEIVLPPTVRGVGRYCFYNCGNLRRIEFHGALSDWGSGAFTGCHGVKSLRVYADADGQSHLKDVLDELREELEVEYWTEEGYAATSEAGVPARLIFPEFYEEGVENTPARILETHVHGSGILYRNCFRGRTFDFAQYDALFPYARAWESEELVLRMALYRLRVPRGLTQKAKEQYESYLAEHAEEAGKWLLERRDLDGVRFLLKRMGDRLLCGRTASKAGGSEEAAEGAGGASRDTLESALLAEASRLQYMEAVSFLMERLSANRHGRPVRRRRLEL